MSLPSPEGPRFSEYTSTNHQAPLWILTCLSLIYSCLFLLARAAVKGKRWALDDGILVSAYTVSFAQWGTIFAALRNGAGKSMDSVPTSRITEVAELMFVSRTITVFTIGLTKCCCIAFMRALFTEHSQRAWRLCTVALGVSAMWTLISTIVISVGCPPAHTVQTSTSNRCSNEIPRMTSLAAVDICIEATIVGLAAYLFSSLQMKRATKVAVISAFAFRLGVIGLFIGYLTSYRSFHTHARTSLHSVVTLAWQQALLAYSLMSATIPCLKGFLGRFTTGDLAKLSESDILNTHGSRSRDRGQNYALSTLDSHGRVGKRSGNAKAVLRMLRPESVRNSIYAYAERDLADGEGSIRSFGSERMIIHRRVEVDVYTLAASDR